MEGVALVLAGVLAMNGPPPAINSFKDLGTALSACIKGDAPAAGLQLEARFVLSERGTTVGRPVVVTRSTAPMADQRAIKATVLDALRRCTPFALAPEFAHAIAGRVLTLRVLTGGRAVLV